MEQTAQVKQRPMSEIRRLVAEDQARFDRLAEVWQELLEHQQVELIKTAETMAYT